jgi:hypothetical protein
LHRKKFNMIYIFKGLGSPVLKKIQINHLATVIF